MRKRIERTLDETLEFFFDELGWGISGAEKTLIKSEDYIDKYRNIYKDLEEHDEKVEQVIDFFYEPMPFGIFWDDGEDDHIYIGYMEIDLNYPKKTRYKYRRHCKGITENNWNNFKEIKTLEELKEYYK